MYEKLYVERWNGNCGKRILGFVPRAGVKPGSGVPQEGANAAPSGQAGRRALP